MAISTYKTYLMSGTAFTVPASGNPTVSTLTKLVDIVSFPDLGGDPEMLDTTTLSDGARTYIPGIQETDALTFECNYTKATFDTIKALEGTEKAFGVYFGDTSGTDGKFVFNGKLSVHVTGAGVNEVVHMNVTIAPSTVIYSLTPAVVSG